MAYYDYKCPECNRVIETEVLCESVKCPCGEQMKRVWTTPAINAGCLNAKNIPKQ